MPEVLRIVPVARSAWHDGVKSGLYPKAARISKRRLAWSGADILALAASWLSTLLALGPPGVGLQCLLERLVKCG